VHSEQIAGASEREEGEEGEGEEGVHWVLQGHTVGDGRGTWKMEWTGMP